MVSVDPCKAQIVAQFEDVALLSVCGRNGRGFFAAYGVLQSEIIHDYRVQPIIS